MSLPTADGAPGSPKPAILCLHGGGTNTIIFNVQLIRIQRALASHFDFVFLDGPYESGPGPDVLPVFEGCGPYRSWISEFFQKEKPPLTKDLLEKTLEEQRAKDGRGFVGVLGFSQGVRVGAGLLLEQQVRRREDGNGLAFGVFCNGTRPPLTSGLSEEERREIIAFPTLHVIGLQDPWRDEGRKMFLEHFDGNLGTIVEFDIGHRLPLLEQDTARIAEEILRMHQKTSCQIQANVP